MSVALKKAHRALPPPIPLGNAGGMARVTPILDGESRMPVRDIIMAICNCETDYASKIWKRISSGEEYTELRNFFCTQYQFPGKGQREMDCICLAGVTKLIMFLPANETVKSCRAKIADTMACHLKGNPSLAVETARDKAIGVAAACSEMLSDAAAEASVKLPIDSGDVEQSITGVIPLTCSRWAHSAPSLLHSAHSAPSPHFA